MLRTLNQAVKLPRTAEAATTANIVGLHWLTNSLNYHSVSLFTLPAFQEQMDPVFFVGIIQLHLLCSNYPLAAFDCPGQRIIP